MIVALSMGMTLELLQLMMLESYWQLWVYLLSLAFACGLAYGSFATKSWVRAEVDKNIERLERQLTRIETRIDSHFERD